MSATELQIHIAITDYLQRVAPRNSPTAPFIWHHSPNGEKRDKRTGAKLKAMGLLPGWPDFVLLQEGYAFFGEVKPANGNLSKSQKAFAQALADQRLYVTSWFHIWRSVNDCEKSLLHWNIIDKGILV